MSVLNQILLAATFDKLVAVPVDVGFHDLTLADLIFVRSNQIFDAFARENDTVFILAYLLMVNDHKEHAIAAERDWDLDFHHDCVDSVELSEFRAFDISRVQLVEDRDHVINLQEPLQALSSQTLDEVLCAVDSPVTWSVLRPNCVRMSVDCLLNDLLEPITKLHHGVNVSLTTL